MQNLAALGKSVDVADPSGHTTTFQYDLMGRRTKTVPPWSTAMSSE